MILFCQNKVMYKSRIKIADLLKSEDYDKIVNVKGWVRTRRGSKSVNFIALNDGSTIKNIQVVADVADFDEELLKQITTGACLSVDGKLVKSIGGGQNVEVQATKIEVLGTCGEDFQCRKRGKALSICVNMLICVFVPIPLAQCSAYATIWQLPYINISMSTVSTTFIRQS